jgi:hypothetical protein
MNNPYQPPRADVAQQVDAKPGSPVKAVLIGALVDTGGTIIAVALVSIAYGIQLGLSGMPPADMAQAFENLPWNSWPSLAGVVMGSLSSVLGGYVCARIVRRQEYRWAGVLSLISVALGFLLGGESGVWQGLLHVAITVACVMAGAWLRVRSVRRAYAAAAGARLSA